MEVVPVSLSDPWVSISVDPVTAKILGFLPIIGFIALLITAIWLQAKKYPVRALGDSGKDNIRGF
tara:strand:+ start:477 stop:671 length:195 start_codon:yes stop_codon:yes gene_type:complete